MTINSVDILPDKNQEDHHTDDYECSLFHVFRRAAPVIIEVARAIDPELACTEILCGIWTIVYVGLHDCIRLHKGTLSINTFISNLGDFLQVSLFETSHIR